MIPFMVHLYAFLFFLCLNISLCCMGTYDLLITTLCTDFLVKMCIFGSVYWYIIPCRFHSCNSITHIVFICVIIIVYTHIFQISSELSKSLSLIRFFKHTISYFFCGTVLNLHISFINIILLALGLKIQASHK